MKESMLEYKGYHTVVRYNATDGTLRGIIEGINDYCAVDDYLIFCEKVGKKTEKKYKGTFNVRIKPALHRKLALRALENGDTLNRAVEKAVSMYLSNHPTANINVAAQQLCENAIKESNINDTKNYSNNVIAFKNSANIKVE